MPRILVSAVPSIVILVVCAWLVQVEGEWYRRRFRETAAKELTTRLVQGHRTVAATTAPTEAGASKAGQAKPDPIEVPKPRSIQSETSAAKNAPRHELNLRDSGDSSRALEQRKTTPTLADAANVPPVPATKPKPKPNWPNDPISWKDPRKLTGGEEAKIGKALHELILRHHQVLGEDAEPAFLNHLYKLSAGLNKENLELSFHILDSNQAFAFSHLGGYVYLSRRLARLVPEDVELEFIIAHEMGHLEKRHGIEKIAKGVGTEGVWPDRPGLVQRFYHQIAAGYDSRQELEADAWACQRLMKLGRSPHGILSFLRRLENYDVRNSRGGPMQPESPVDAEVQAVERHWRTHPRVPLRLLPLQELTDAAHTKSSR